MLRTASSIEVLAINTYETALKSGLLTTPDVKSAVELFKSQHEDHANLLYTATTDAGGDPYKLPNPYLSYEVVAPTLKTHQVRDRRRAAGHRRSRTRPARPT